MQYNNPLDNDIGTILGYSAQPNTHHCTRKGSGRSAGCYQWTFDPKHQLAIPWEGE